MRHGRKSKAHPFTGYKHHVLNLLGSKLVVEAVCQPANQADYDLERIVAQRSRSAQGRVYFITTPSCLGTPRRGC
jgi:hypothetical protein